MTENQICIIFGTVTGALLMLVVTGIVTLEMLLVIYVVGIIGFGFIVPIASSFIGNWWHDKRKVGK